jgi:hypothetical protein
MPSHHVAKQNRRGNAARLALPYRREDAGAPSADAARIWPADSALDAMLIKLARALVEGAPGQSMSIAQLGDRIAVRMRQKGVHPRRDGKIVRLSAYVRAAHGGWEAFLASRVGPPYRLDEKRSRLYARVDESAAAPLEHGRSRESGMMSGLESSMAAPRVQLSVDDLDLSVI